MKSKIIISLFAVLASLAFPFANLEASGGDHYASYWKCSDGNTYGLSASGNKRWLHLPSAHAPLFFSGEKRGNMYVGTVHIGNRCIPVSGPVTNHSTRVTLYAADGCYWVLNFSHK